MSKSINELFRKNMNVLERMRKHEFLEYKESRFLSYANKKLNSEDLRYSLADLE